MPGTTGGPGMNLMLTMFRMILVPALLAALPLAAGAAVTPVDSTDLPEEIVVNAPESLNNLRLEINQARIAMFDVFNEINGDDRFDVHCEYVRRWQSKIREWVCSPVYLKTAQVQEVNLLLRQMGHTGAEVGGPGVTQMDYMNAQFEEKMKALFEEHPEFRQAVNNYNSLEQILKSVRSERFEK